MGLDNSVFRVDRRKIVVGKPFDMADYYEDSDEICYWRKCYDMRDNILSVLGYPLEGEGWFEIDEDTIDDVLDVVAESIVAAADDDESFAHGEFNLQNLGNLYLARKDLMSSKPRYKYYFYDSY